MSRKKDFKNMTYEELLAEDAALKKHIQQLKNKECLEMNRSKSLARKRRNHRLVTKGVAVEKQIPEFEVLTEQEFTDFMIRVIEIQEVKEQIRLTMKLHKEKELASEKEGEA